MKGIFGWSYPPGCDRVPGDEPSFCEVCGGNVDNGNCICPECPQCGETGNPLCYKEHGITVSKEQQEQKLQYEKYWEDRDADIGMIPDEEY